MAGYASESDANAGVYEPMGVIQVTLSAIQIGAFFATAQSNLIAFVTAMWPDAVFPTS